jgi:hypothetical protein
VKKIKKSKSIKQLDKSLWTVFSEFIRLRDRVSSSHFVCIACGEPKPLNQMQAGHYFERTNKAIKYNEKNVNCECISCNYYHREDSKSGYKEGLIKKYGPGIIEELEIKKSRSNNWSHFEYEILIKEYKEKVKKMRLYYAAPN